MADYQYIYTMQGVGKRITAYEEDKKRRLGDAAIEPHRIKHKKLA